jgi:purine nucleosidase
VTLAMLGPQTNLALALEQAPDIVRGLRELVLMAGAHFNGGNITPTAEFNVFADPHAAEAVLKCGVPITMLPLDVTHKILTSDERIARLRGIGNQAGKIVADILDAYAPQEMQHYDMPGGPVHDATVIAYLLQPSLFSGRLINIEIDSREGMGFGQTVADWYGSLNQPANANWVVDGDAQGFFDLLTEHIARLP